MTEYWKSNARKFCDFCKCWLADNKVSISFHESGKRHKENVQKHISQLTKKSAKDFKQKTKLDDDIKKMEEAAMAAYMKDVKNNADITSQNINNILNEQKSGCAPVICTEDSVVCQQMLWQEVKSEDDSVYYWNKDTNETTWDPPDKYISLAQQEEEKLREKEQQKAEKRLKKQKQEEAKMEVKAHMAREKHRERAVKSTVEVKAAPACGPAPRAPDPYGGWTPIPEKSPEKVDLQLPKTSRVEVVCPVVLEPETIKFNEKKVESLGEGLVDFKKRKINSNFKRNMRQKMDDD